ncbi:hypothetical protein BBP40_010506 [Aspergillus hancockii]|nr:hypothetical protein BBP40_010506 [Aspergillus hancockii]
MTDIRTIIKCAIDGPTSPFSHSGKVTTFRMWLDGRPIQDGGVGVGYFQPAHTIERIKVKQGRRGKSSAGGDSDTLLASWTVAEDPLTGLIEALLTNIAAMTMMEPDDMHADAPFASFGLDTLVSVELRNWIRREAGIELTLSAITYAKSQQALATEVLARRGAAQNAL